MKIENTNRLASGVLDEQRKIAEARRREQKKSEKVKPKNKNTIAIA